MILTEYRGISNDWIDSAIEDYKEKARLMKGERDG